MNDVTIAGKTIRKDQNLTVMLGAANRDPRRFDGPDQLRLDRENPAPLSFGLGIHHCVGAAPPVRWSSASRSPIVDAFGDYTINPNDVAWKTSLRVPEPDPAPGPAREVTSNLSDVRRGSPHHRLGQPPHGVAGLPERLTSIPKLRDGLPNIEAVMVANGVDPSQWQHSDDERERLDRAG